MAYADCLKMIEKAAREGALELDLSRQGLETLPPEIGRLTQLKSLNLSNNKLTEVPTAITQLSRLTELNLHNNQLPEVPTAIYELTQLTELNLSNNRLTEVSAAIAHLTQLTDLVLSNNQLTEVPAAIAQLARLTSLGLNGNRLTEVPTAIAQLTQLSSLGLSHNQLTEVPAAITQLTQLSSLGLSSNRLREVPAAITQLTQLSSLGLSGNQLTDVPAAITQLTQLSSLGLSHNQLTAVPAAIAHLTQLTDLVLSNNQLTEVPAAITQLTQLTSINLGYNQLTEVPGAITQLTQLTSLGLNGNRLRGVPVEITRLTDLRTLDLRDNEALDLPPEIVNQWRNAQSILRYIEQIAGEEPKRPLNEAKVVLVGEGRVGKTSLVNMLLEGRADPHESQTEGIDIRRWPLALGDETVQLNVWDFGGQEIMHATHQFFLTRRSLYLLVLNAREGETRGRLDYWLKIIGSFGGDSPVIVVTNWSDENRLQLNRGDLQEKYPGRIRAFVDTACMGPLKGESGNGIDDLKKHIAKEISALEHLRNPLLTRWFEVKKQLEEMKENYIPESEYTRMCEGQGITDERDRALLLGYLNDLGVVLTFRDDRRLRDTNILNPEWVTQGIYKILNSNELFQSKGVLRTAALTHILDRGEYPPDKHEFLIGMMRKFELCFAFEGRDDTYLIPDLLPKEQPALNWDEETALGWEYHYDVLPGSVISRFIVRTSHLLPKDQMAYWRSGVVLDIEGNKARVKADSDSRKATVSILGREPGCHRALAVIRDHFAHIHETIPGIVVEEKGFLTQMYARLGGLWVKAGSGRGCEFGLGSAAI